MPDSGKCLLSLFFKESQTFKEMASTPICHGSINYNAIAEPDSSISFRQFNIIPCAPQVQLTCFGKVRAFHTFKWFEWLYLAVSILALAVALGLTIERLTVEKPCGSDFALSLLLMLTIICCIHYVIHSIFTERWNELMVFVVSNVTVMAYCIISYCGGMHFTLKLVHLILVCFFGPILIFFGIFLSIEYYCSNHLIHNSVGGLASLQKSCKLYYICSSLLKFDLQLQLSMLFLVVGKSILKMSLKQKLILASGVPVTTLVFAFGWLGIRKENKIYIVIFYILSLFEPGYIIYKFYYTCTQVKHVDETYYATFVCGGLASVIWIMLIISIAHFVCCHFGKGLKEKLFEEKEENRQGQSPTTSANVEASGV